MGSRVCGHYDRLITTHVKNAAEYPAKICEAEDHRPDVVLLGHKIGISNKTSFLFQFMLKTGLF